MIPLYWPVDAGYAITQVFGCTGYPAEPPLGGCAHFHRGIDLGNGTAGGKIYAAADGTVRFAGLISVMQTNGTVVQQSLITLDHGQGIATFYIHEQTPLMVKVGQSVIAHQQIAKVGSTGAPAAHLHFAVKSGVDWSTAALPDNNGTWLDPEEVTLQMYAVDTRTPLAEPNPRAFTVAAGAKVYYYDPATPGLTMGPLPAGTYHADASDNVAWYQTSAPPVPRGGPFLHVTDGPAKGHLVVQALVTLSPPSPPPPTPTPLGAGVYQVK